MLMPLSTTLLVAVFALRPLNVAQNPRPDVPLDQQPALPANDAAAPAPGTNRGRMLSQAPSQLGAILKPSSPQCYKIWKSSPIVCGHKMDLCLGQGQRVSPFEEDRCKTDITAELEHIAAMRATHGHNTDGPRYKPWYEIRPVMKRHNHSRSCAERGRHLRRFGGYHDGGYWLCASPALCADNCVVYSFGIGGNPNFDKDVLRGTSCSVHMFDPTVGVGSKLMSKAWYKTYSKKATFHPWGLAAEDVMQECTGCWTHSDFKGSNGSQTEMLSLRGINRRLKTSPTVLKIDIENFEVRRQP